MRPILLAACACLLPLAARAAPVAVYDAAAPAKREVITAPANGRKLIVRTAGFTDDAYLAATTPDGKRIAVLMLAPPLGASGSLFLGGARGGRFADATGGLSGRPLTAAFSADGRALFFEHRAAAGERSDVFRLDTRTRRRACLTAGLTGTASPAGDSTEIRGGPRGRAAFLFDHKDRRALLLSDGEAVVDATAGLGAGEPEEDFAFLPEGDLLFRFTPDGAPVPSLFRHDGSTALVVTSARSFSIAGGTFAALLPDRLRVWGPEGILDHSASDAITGFALSPGRAAFVTRDGGGRVRLYVGEGASHREVLADHALEAVETLRFAGDALTCFVREGGLRRLFVMGPSGETEPAAGLGGDLGAFLGVSPAGDRIVFALLAPGGASGSLVAWSPAGGAARDLSQALDFPTVPGEAVFAAGGPDVLYTLKVGADREPRLFLWQPRRDRFTALSLPGLRVGRFVLGQ